MKKLFVFMLVLVTAIGPLSLSAAPAVPADEKDESLYASEDGDHTRRILEVFRDISQIPRCSKNEKQISAWLVEWATKREFPVETDQYDNVLIAVPASAGYEGRPAVILQNHMDMVCQKTDDSDHEFSRDPISLVRNGDWLTAADTTLGADNGIGMAIAMALAEDRTLKRPALELLFTTDEEMGMTGAAGLTGGFLPAARLINIDSGPEGVITLGSAGGNRLQITMPLDFSPLDTYYTTVSLHINGLQGGHSGVDISKNRANANALIAQALHKVPFLRMISFSGGSVDNAITPSSEMAFALPANRLGPLMEHLIVFRGEIRSRFPEESGLEIHLYPVMNGPGSAASETASARALELLMDIPQGVHEWSERFPGLPETSNNIGIVRLNDQTLSIVALQRSFDPGKLDALTRNIEDAAVRANAEHRRGGSFPVWPPDPESDLYHKALTAYERIFDNPPRTEAVHAGLECGYFAEKFPEMDIISVGPTAEHSHTVNERLYVPSLERVWHFLRELLQDL